MRLSLLDKTGSFISGLMTKVGVPSHLISKWEDAITEQLVNIDGKLPATRQNANDFVELMTRRAKAESGQNLLFNHYLGKYISPRVKTKNVGLYCAYDHLSQLDPAYRHKARNWAYQQALSQARKGEDASAEFDAILRDTPKDYRQNHIASMALNMPHDAFGAWMQTTDNNQNLVDVSHLVKNVLTIASIDAWCLEGYDWDIHTNAQTLLHKILGTEWLGQATSTSVDAMEKKSVAGSYQNKFVVLSPRLNNGFTSVLAYAYDMESTKLHYVTSNGVRDQNTMMRLMAHADKDNTSKTEFQAEARFKAFTKASRRLLARQRSCRPVFLTALKAKMPENHPFQRIRSTLWTPTR